MILAKQERIQSNRIESITRMKKQNMRESRDRFDKSLASSNISSKEAIKALVENQLQRSTFSGSQEDLHTIAQKRALEVSIFLDMLRSASNSNGSPPSSSQNDWKLKQESDQLRVMYREGPTGSPFHTLLAEGFVDGPVDIGLCVSWEATLYKNWWPQYNVPTFKIVSSSSLQKVRTGEEISLIRVKPPWPVTEREAILHSFEVEFFQEQLILVLLKTIPSDEKIDLSTHGFSNAGIPDAKDAVRIDIVGGFALQKVSTNRSYFRVIANMDIKLDFVPPSLINFISRQLIGNGHKLYQKAVASVVGGDEKYGEALKDAMYIRIRECLYSSSNHLKPRDLPQKILEIEEELHSAAPRSNPPTSGSTDNSRKNGDYISPEVVQALGILDDAITLFRDLGSPNGEASPVIQHSRSESSSESEAQKPSSLSERMSKVFDEVSADADATRQATYYAHSSKPRKKKQKKNKCLVCFF